MTDPPVEEAKRFEPSRILKERNLQILGLILLLFGAITQLNLGLVSGGTNSPLVAGSILIGLNAVERTIRGK